MRIWGWIFLITAWLAGAILVPLGLVTLVFICAMEWSYGHGWSMIDAILVSLLPLAPLALSGLFCAIGLRLQRMARSDSRTGH
jgi:hypothetical protein